MLLFDLCHVNNRFSEARTLLTTDPLYISSPYFTAEEATLIKGTVIHGNGAIEAESLEPVTTVQSAIEEKLSRFLDKRKALGDFRPCGPHDMAPIYLEIFGITKAELKSDSFLERMRRSGFGQGERKGKGS